jgi:hypothetical protein
MSFLPFTFNPTSPDFLNPRHVHDPAFLPNVFKQVSYQSGFRTMTFLAVFHHDPPPLPIVTMSLPSLKFGAVPPPVLRQVCLNSIPLEETGTRHSSF